MPSRSRTLVALALLVGWGALQASAQVIEVGGWVKPDGSLEKSRIFIVMKDGLITAVSTEPLVGAPITMFEDAVVAPGMIDLSGGLGALGSRTEEGQPLEPAAQAADALDRYQAYTQRLVHEGVTAFALAPTDENLIGGQIAVVHSVDANQRPHVLNAAGPLHVSLSPDVYRIDREPTSRTGALGMLRRTLRKAAATKDTGALAQFARGERMGLITAPSAADVLAVKRLAEQMNLKVALRHTVDGMDVADLTNGMTVVAGPLGAYDGPRRSMGAGAMSNAGANVALTASYPSATPNALRHTAAVAMRHGLTPDAARRAVTSVPAEILGIGDVLGSIEKGKRADLVLWSGDPLDLRSRVVAVYIGGQRLKGANNE